MYALKIIKGNRSEIAGAIELGAGLDFAGQNANGLPVIVASGIGVGGGELNHGTVTTSVTPDLAAASTHVMTLGGNVTINNPVNATAGHSYAFVLIQDATGNRSVTWGNNFRWPDGLAFVPSTSANAIDIVTCIAITVGGVVRLFAVGQNNFS